MIVWRVLINLNNIYILYVCSLYRLNRNVIIYFYNLVSLKIIKIEMKIWLLSMFIIFWIGYVNFDFVVVVVKNIVK